MLGLLRRSLASSCAFHAVSPACPSSAAVKSASCRCNLRQYRQQSRRITGQLYVKFPICYYGLGRKTAISIHASGKLDAVPGISAKFQE